uniref:WD repeat-containing protein 26-like n=1 Tax=Dermatophagoides pteronyssinus TaxID=6956 RepID=A0A6P6Y1D7_DERPT|nr:WD repeat-containing protein 26-like [Dermatophagoides pteronyssinus]
MHSFGVTNGSGHEEQSSSSSSNTTPLESNGLFIANGGDVQTNGAGSGSGGGQGGNNVAGGTGMASNGNSNISNGNTAESSNGVSNNYTNGSANNNDDDDLDGYEDGPYMNGNAHRKQPPNRKNKAFVPRSPSEFDIIRLIGQQLCIMGLDQTVEQLIKESGCRLDHPTAAKFRSYVMNGQWEKADTTLKELQNYLVNPKHLVKMKFLLLEQKYLECIEDGREIDAVHCLQNEITQLKYNMGKLPTICSYLFMNSKEELRRVANWDGKGHVSRSKLMEKLQNFLPATIMLPPRRLQSLLNQAIEFQKERCPYHNIKVENGLDDFSLLVDHLCCKDDLPSETLQILTEHKDEVWFCRFSNDGTRLATGSKDGNITIWTIDPETFQLTLKYTLIGHTFGVAYLAWSPDDHYLLALGPEESSEFWLWDTHTGTLKTKSCHSNDDSLIACAWHKDGKKFIAGGTRGQFYQIDLNGTVIDSWEGVRVMCLAYKNDGKTVLAADTHHRIRGYNFEDLTDFNVLKEDHSIMSFVCDESGRLALINIENQGVHLWDIEDRILLRKFQGITQGLYTIHSCFGGVDQLFVASGSEDNKVYIWHLKREHPISVLKGHTRTVNCVHWNPRYPHLLASASDDTTVRIWCAKHRNQHHHNQANNSVNNNNHHSSSSNNNNHNRDSISLNNLAANNRNTSSASSSTIQPPTSSSGHQVTTTMMSNNETTSISILPTISSILTTTPSSQQSLSLSSIRLATYVSSPSPSASSNNTTINTSTTSSLSSSSISNPHHAHHPNICSSSPSISHPLSNISLIQHQSSGRMVITTGSSMTADGSNSNNCNNQIQQPSTSTTSSSPQSGGTQRRTNTSLTFYVSSSDQSQFNQNLVGALDAAPSSPTNLPPPPLPPSSALTSHGEQQQQQASASSDDSSTSSSSTTSPSSSSSSTTASSSNIGRI